MARLHKGSALSVGRIEVFRQTRTSSTLDSCNFPVRTCLFISLLFLLTEGVGVGGAGCVSVGGGGGGGREAGGICTFVPPVPLVPTLSHPAAKQASSSEGAGQLSQ